MTSKRGKITQYSRVFERLMARETIDHIRMDISGSSALQRGIQMYVERMQGDIPERAHCLLCSQMDSEENTERENHTT
jgi:hypothetical protein